MFWGAALKILVPMHLVRVSATRFAVWMVRLNLFRFCDSVSCVYFFIIKVTATAQNATPRSTEYRWGASVITPGVRPPVLARRGGWWSTTGIANYKAQNHTTIVHQCSIDTVEDLSRKSSLHQPTTTILILSCWPSKPAEEGGEYRPVLLCLTSLSAQ